MRWQFIFLILVSVLLSSTAQVMLKFGSASLSIQKAVTSQSMLGLASAMIASPPILLGLFSFGLSLILWIIVLSRIDISYAYPFVALGICMTIFAGWLFLNETISALRLAGLMLIVIGVITVAKS